MLLYNVQSSWDQHTSHTIGIARVFDGGGANHKSRSMMSSEIFEEGSFCEEKVS